MNKKAVIIHCWTGDPEYCWYPYLKRNLEERGYGVTVPFLGEPLPLAKKWVEKIRIAVGSPDYSTFLIGHSLGAVAILKYLQSLPVESKVGQVILVSPFINDLGIGPLSNFFDEPFDYDYIRQKAHEFVIIASGDDPYISPKHIVLLRRYLQARMLWKSLGGHFTESADKVQYKEFPEILSIVDQFITRVESDFEEGRLSPVQNLLQGAII